MKSNMEITRDLEDVNIGAYTMFISVNVKDIFTEEI